MKLWITKKRLISYLESQRLNPEDWAFFKDRAKESEEDRMRLIRIQSEQDMLNRIIKIFKYGDY